MGWALTHYKLHLFNSSQDKLVPCPSRRSVPYSPPHPEWALYLYKLEPLIHFSTDCALPQFKVDPFNLSCYGLGSVTVQTGIPDASQMARLGRWMKGEQWMLSTLTSARLLTHLSSHPHKQGVHHASPLQHCPVAVTSDSNTNSKTSLRAALFFLGTKSQPAQPLKGLPQISATQISPTFCHLHSFTPGPFSPSLQHTASSRFL